MFIWAVAAVSVALSAMSEVIGPVVRDRSTFEALHQRIRKSDPADFRALSVSSVGQLMEHGGRKFHLLIERLVQSTT
jgi:hypothetical protein